MSIVSSHIALLISITRKKKTPSAILNINVRNVLQITEWRIYRDKICIYEGFPRFLLSIFIIKFVSFSDTYFVMMMEDPTVKHYLSV